MNFNDLDPTLKEVLVNETINFMRTLTMIFGQEEGLKLYDTIADTLGPDLKGQVFFAMLTGNNGSDVTMRSTSTNKIETIKAIRSFCNLGLKEAKDAYDRVASGSTERLKVQPFAGKSLSVCRSEFIRELNRLGNFAQ
jgi:ribosomal protein L7/L12